MTKEERNEFIVKADEDDMVSFMSFVKIDHPEVFDAAVAYAAEYRVLSDRARKATG